MSDDTDTITDRHAEHDERASLHAALAFGGFTDADEAERVAMWAARHIEQLEAERERLRDALTEISAYSWSARTQQARDAISAIVARAIGDEP